MIGVDCDWFVSIQRCRSHFASASLWMTSYEVIKQVLDGTFKGGDYVGTLENGGTTPHMAQNAVDNS